MMDLSIKPVKKLSGEVKIPGDKSISHRAVIFGSLAEGDTYIKGFLESEDCLKTVRAFRLMGVKIDRLNPGEYQITGTGLKGLSEPEDIIDCGNSGTTMRLLCGLLAAQPFYSVLTGDDSLRRRPMDRIIEPLNMMGANIWGRDDKFAPLSIKGSKLTGLKYNLPVASAQLKSALLLAGLYARGDIKIIEPGEARDHTERFLNAFGACLEINGPLIHLRQQHNLTLAGRDVTVPADFSSAAFFIVAALIADESELLIKNVGINPTRSGLLEIIKEMNGDIKLKNKRIISGEPVADIKVKSSQLKGVTIRGEIIPRLIDELPIIAVLASRASGETLIRDARELRVKETDRIAALVDNLIKLGVTVDELEDGMLIKGTSRLNGGVRLKSYGDHRIAMSMAVAGLIADSEITLDESESIKTSFPGFFDILTTISIR